ncbi:MAG: hypothetical protein MUF25_24345, partial [Pirellulaceae bacterium]|nr:hypothetical protein [Pirellulaceae bacterium]
MVRNAFREGRPYAARLLRVCQRPIENDPRCGFCLLRLEFEIFLVLDTEPVLASTGKIACRDLVVGPAVDVSRDASLVAYVDALRVRKPSNIAEWLNLTSQV